MRLLPVLLFLITSVAECLMLSRVLVPQYKLFGEDALLRCDYDLGRDRLYAVKWYKDNEEFFRFVPRFNPPIYTHPVDGVRVDNLKSNDKRVLLRSLTVRSSGGYRCEVSAEAPSFASIMGEGRMTVVYLPKDPPQITGNLRTEYEVGNVLDLNCTSAKSFPPAKLSWYINDSPVHVLPGSISIHPALLASSSSEQNGHNSMIPGVSSSGVEEQRQRHVSSGGGGLALGGGGSGVQASLQSSLMISSLRLRLQLESHHFGPKGTAKVRCVARISPLFWQDGDEKILSGYQHGGQGHNSRGHGVVVGGGNGNGGGGHNLRHGRKKTLSYGDEEEEEEEEGDEDRPEVEDSHPHSKSAHHQNNYNSHNNKQGQYRHHGAGGGGGGGGNVNYKHNNGYRGRDDDDLEEGEDDDEEELNEYYGLGLPAFQREALVLVRGSCSNLKPVIILSKYLSIIFVGFWVLLKY